MTEVRPFTSGDVATVAALFQRTFRDGRGPAPASLSEHLESVFLHHPWQDPEVSSRVHVNTAGAVNGFIGVMPLRLRLGDRRVRAGLAGSLMVDDPAADPLAGARLLRAFFKGPQDLSLSETANGLAHKMWEKLGGPTIGGLSMDFLRLFRPAGTATAVARSRTRMAAVLRPFAAAMDAVALRIAGEALKPDPAALVAEFVDDEALVPALLSLGEAQALRPDWDPQTLRWLLRNAELKERYGTLRRRVFRRRSGEIAGAALYYSRPRDIAWVLQMLALPGAEQTVADDLLAAAFADGAVAIRGRVTPAFHEALLRRGAFFHRRSAFVAQARDKGLVEAVGRSDALVTGLAGETWSRLIGGEFR